MMSLFKDRNYSHLSWVILNLKISVEKQDFDGESTIVIPFSPRSFLCVPCPSCCNNDIKSSWDAVSASVHHLKVSFYSMYLLP